jgi:alpha-beta hydrolase superfamily lysophospholipase
VVFIYGMKILFGLVAVSLLLYAALCAGLYFRQERLLFYPTVLPPAFRFHFVGPFEERWITAADGKRLHGLLFKVPHAKGVIFYLHGNGGALDSWGEVAPTYTALGYDVFMLDYRGYGKSEGTISSQAQFLGDVEAAYQPLAQQYGEGRTVILGHSIGTGPAAWLAARHQPKLLILQAPYYSMTDLVRRLYPFVPGFVLRYPLPTNEVIGQVKAPVVLFHGRQDAVISYESSVKLQQLLGANGQLVILEGVGHSSLTDNAVYRQKLAELL